MAPEPHTLCPGPVHHPTEALASPNKELSPTYRTKVQEEVTVGHRPSKNCRGP